MAIMVVDDHPGTRQAAVRHLQHSGFETLDVMTGNDALSMLEENPRITFIFVNLSLGGDVDADALAARAHSRWPCVPILLTHQIEEMVRLTTPSLARLIARD